MNESKDMVKVTIRDQGIVQITLNRPEQLNALSQAVLEKLSYLLDQIREDKSAKAILLSGEGKTFSAGADVKELLHLTGQEGLKFAHLGQAVFRKLELLGKPSLAAIHGFAYGGGCELAMAATLRIATSNTTFGQPEIKLGVMPGFGGTQRLPRLVGKGRALELCLTGRRFTAAEALQWGLLNEVVAPEDLINRAMVILQSIVELSPIAIQSIMTVIQQTEDMPIDEGQALEAAHFGICCSTKDKQEGVNAFLQKRAAVFSGE